MTSFYKISKATLLFSFFISLNLKAQFSISNMAQIWRIKSGITYIVMKDPDAEKVKDYVEVFKKYWTISEFQFIKYSEMKKYLNVGNSFFMIGHEELSPEISRTGAINNIPITIGSTSTHLYLELWTITEDQFNKIRKKFSFENSDKTQFARIELFTDYDILFSPSIIDYLDYDGNGRIRNWGPGILKNYLQLLMTRLDIIEHHTLKEEIHNATELKKLQDEVLYVPNYILIKHDVLNDDDLKKNEEQEIFESYKFKYKLISSSELNQKILSNPTGFYYLIYVKSDTEKYINVINSLTGEIIYATSTRASHNIKPKDLKILYKKIKSN